MSQKHKQPIYLHLRESVRNKIEIGEYSPGSSIPSENELAGIYGTNRQTVRNAIDVLVNEGLLIRVQGKGVYVTGDKIEQNLDKIGGFTQVVRNSTANCKNRIITQVTRSAGVYYGRVFDVDPDSEIFYIKYLVTANNTVVSLEESYAPVYILPSLLENDLSVFTIKDIYNFHGIEIKKESQVIGIVDIKGRDFKYLNLDQNVVVMQLSNESYGDRDRIILITNTWARSDRCRFTVHYRR